MGNAGVQDPVAGVNRLSHKPHTKVGLIDSVASFLLRLKKSELNLSGPKEATGQGLDARAYITLPRSAVTI